MGTAVTGPVVLALVFLVVAALVAFTGGPRREVPERPTVDRAWARQVRQELVSSWRRVNLGPAAAGRMPVVHGDGTRVEGGWRWTISTPGSVTAAEMAAKADAVSSALNVRRQLVGALEVRPGRHEGWVTLSAWPRDPLAGAREVPWEPGRPAPCCPPGVICAGVVRDGSHAHVPLVGGAGAVCALFGGRRGSGKSLAMLGWVAQAVAWGWVDVVLIDTVRHGTDLGVFEPLAAAPLVTTVNGATSAFQQMRAECDRRARAMAGHARCLTEFDARVPMILPVVDELQGIMGDAGCKVEATRFAQETRAMGGSLLGATQYPTTEVVDSTFRQQFAYRLAFRCSNAAEGPVILGASPDGEGPHQLRQGAGTCVADLDVGGFQTLRTWLFPDQWLREHVRLLAGTRISRP